MEGLWPLLLAAAGTETIPLTNTINVTTTQVIYSVTVSLGTPAQEMELMLEMSSTVRYI